MRYDPEKHRRRSIRLKGYDYTQAGAYFITLCTYERQCLFGEVVDGVMRLNQLGLIVREEWIKTALLRPRVVLDAFVVMPNHLHGIIVLNDICRGTRQRAPTVPRAPKTPVQQCPTTEQFGKPTSDSIPTIVRSFKSATTKRINALRATPGAPVWQRNYYEHIVRNEHDLERIRQYIAENPARWHLDRENPHATGQTPTGIRCWRVQNGKDTRHRAID